jgi:hypothetical protein
MYCFQEKKGYIIFFVGKSMIIGYQKIDTFSMGIKKRCNLGIDKLNHCWNNIRQNYSLLSNLPNLNIKPFITENTLSIKERKSLELYWTDSPYAEIIFRSVIKNLDPNKPYIIFSLFTGYNSLNLFDGIYKTENTVFFNSPTIHTPINFFDDLFQIGSIKEILNILKPYEEEYKKYLYDKDEISKIIKTIKVLMSYLCMLLKRKREKGASIDLNVIKATLENFDLYQKNKYYLKLLDEMNYLNKKIILNYNVRHYQLTQIVWQIYFAHFILLEKQELISNKTTLNVRQLIKAKKNYIFTPIYFNKNCASQEFITNLFKNYINTLLKEESAQYQVVLPIQKIDSWDFHEKTDFKIILNNHEMSELDLNIIEEKMKKEQMLVLLNKVRFDKLSYEKYLEFTQGMNLSEILNTKAYFIYLNNHWQKCDKLHENTFKPIDEIDIEKMKHTQLTIVDEMIACNEKSILDKILNEPILIKEEKKKRIKI